MSSSTPTVPRPPDSALASAAKAGTVGLLAAKIGEAVAQSWIVPALVSVLVGADAATLDTIRSTTPLVFGGAALALVTGLGGLARDYAAAKGGATARFVGRFFPVLALAVLPALGCSGFSPADAAATEDAIARLALRSARIAQFVQCEPENRTVTVITVGERQDVRLGCRGQDLGFLPVQGCGEGERQVGIEITKEGAEAVCEPEGGA